ncbi:MAG: NHLP family bacteriocin export ABC transporter peptidase/permease/ATPase subunit [Clostridiales bacterium]|nr:NHLP family bacteriocin export ABC transporter peptidase/permease/ATPase subunit [Clostridiales bacterium]
MKKTYYKTPTIFQMEATECGAASLAMICAYWGKYIPLEQMRVETGVSRDGCNAANIMRAARRFGMECHGYRKEPEALRTIDLPCMIHWNFNHFVVLEGFKGNYAYLNDPAMGRRRLTMEELDESFTGVVLTFRPTEAFEKARKENTLLPLILRRLDGQKAALAQMLCIGILLILPGLIVPVLSQIFLDEILGSGGVSWFGQFLGFWAAVMLFRIGLELYQSKLLLKMQNKLVLLSSREFLESLFRLPVNFFDQRSAGDLVGRIGNNDNVNSFITGNLADLVLDIFVAAFYLILLLIYSPVMTAIGLVGIVFQVVLVKVTSAEIANRVLKLQQDKGKLAGAVCAGLSVTSTLKASGAEGTYSSRILGYEAKAFGMEQEISRFQTITGALPGAVSSLIDVILLIVGARLVIEGQMTLGMLAAFTSLFSSFSEPVEELVSFVKQIQTLKADMERVDDIMRYPQDEQFEDRETAKMPQAKLSGRVELADISFGYSRLAPPLVTDFSVNLEAGRSVAFVGASGCGKSTVSKIVSGLYQPWGGCVKFDGIPLREIAPEILHASVSTVSQNITLFSGTIRDNLTMWNPAVLEKDMIQAAKDACIHDVIAQKPGAYDFMLAEGGANLSGGQRQRLEIARALATNPTILIMDEATSALDPITEKKIIDHIKRRGCTCLIVAHRLSAVRNSDEIVVMNRGSIVERGSHEELAALDGYYRRFMATD